MTIGARRSVLNSVTEVEKILRQTKKRKISAAASLYPDIPEELVSYWIRGIRDSQSAVAAILVLWKIVPGHRNRFKKEKMFVHLAHLAYANRYNGRWSLVQELLELREHSLIAIISKILENESTNYLFGNLIPLTQRLLSKTEKRTYYRSVKTDSRPVRYPQRKRGYSDRGHWSPSSSWKPKRIHPSRLPEPRKDLRPLVVHNDSPYLFSVKEKVKNSE